jgi:ATP-binding cassette subfamily B protein
MIKSEFNVPTAYRYDQRSAGRWIVSHVLRYKGFLFVTLLGFMVAWTVFTQAQVQIGRAAEAIAQPESGSLVRIALTILALLAVDGISVLTASLSAENIASRIATDAREELYVSLLGKSKTFHDRQRVGDIMARATEDVSQLSSMIVPGATMIFETILGITVPLLTIASLRLELVTVPILFVVAYIVTVRLYLRRLSPIMMNQRNQFGTMNAGLEETLSGIEVVKASARELFEQRKFRTTARMFRDLFVLQGRTEARYLPLLIYGVAFGLTFLHALFLYQQGRIGIAEIIGVMALMNVLRFPTFISVFSFSVVQTGVAGARRILHILRAETDLDENVDGYNTPIAGAITFENVSFAYDEGPVTKGERNNDSGFVHRPSSFVLKDISFSIEPGQTVAIVGQTGSGKTALTQLVNRTYDVTAGRVLIDGVDVRDWSLTGLRSQIAKIEQDIFLFSRSIAENIAFGAPDATREQIEQAAREAQAHEFIMSFAEGYETVVGERGTMLSGGQRQRIALARAFLSNPRILILDDSTSAIDSATEDQIQRAIRRAQQGRTTLLITHRLSQIRWADYILVVDHGQVVASGTHDDLLRRSPHYRRIFARYDMNLPPMEEEEIVDCRLQIAD